MRSLYTLLQLCPVTALSFPYRMLTGGFTDINVLHHDIETASTKFEVAPGYHDTLTSPLVFDLQINPSQDLLTSNVVLNAQPLDITWSSPVSTDAATVLPKIQHLSVPDRSGFSHDLQLSVSGEITSFADVSDAVQSLILSFDAVDGSNTGLSFTVITQPTATRRLLKLVPAVTSDIVHFDRFEKSFMVDEKSFRVTVDDVTDQDDNAYDIESELESLLLLEAEASELQASITAKKETIAKCLKGRRDQATLRHLLSQCDDVVCAAKVIAQRLCDKMGIMTVPHYGYAKMQGADAQTVLDFHNDMMKPTNATKIPIVSEKNLDFVHHENAPPMAAVQSIRVVYPQSLLLKVLGIIGTVLGLSALFSFIHRKCMSARRRVERAADVEERRNARAYRRAARRVEMRRRWNAFVSAINCFGSKQEPRNEDYEEKRALILQDAFLEQDVDAAEKGDIMEAEIRQLRHAHEVVSSLVLANGSRYHLNAPVRDPPPPMVPLPYTPVSRSRASSATLPSYTSETLPDYTSRYTKTEAGSSSSSLRSTSISEGSSIQQHTSVTTSENDDRSTSRSQSPVSSNNSRRNRYTPTSSVVETSPRISAETLRTICRLSLNTTGGSI